MRERREGWKCVYSPKIKGVCSGAKNDLFFPEKCQFLPLSLSQEGNRGIRVAGCGDFGCFSLDPGLSVCPGMHTFITFRLQLR